jgi:AcrR family transcriptional regulator
MPIEHDSLRTKLIETAFSLIDSGGVSAVQARALSTGSGVSVGTIYNVFGSVDDLLDAAGARVAAALGERGRASVARVATIFDAQVAQGAVADTARNRTLLGLMGVSQTMIDFVATNPRRWCAMVAHQRRRMAGHLDVTGNPFQPLVDTLAQVLKDAPAWSAEQQRDAARALWESLHGIVTSTFASGDAALARGQATTLTNILLKTLVDGMFAGGRAQSARQPADDSGTEVEVRKAG